MRSGLPSGLWQLVPAAELGDEVRPDGIRRRMTQPKSKLSPGMKLSLLDEAGQEVVKMRRCRLCGRRDADHDELYCGRCDKIQGDVAAALAAELRAGLAR